MPNLFFEATKLIIGANFALPAACLCVCIHLEAVSSVRHARTSLSDKRKRQIFEAVMCFGLPILFMVLRESFFLSVSYRSLKSSLIDYVVQGHRFDIIEGYGCRPTTYFSIAAIFIVWLPPLILSIGAIVFAGLALRHFIQRRISFATHLAAHSALTTSRYLRLMLMSILQMVWSITVTSYALWFTVVSIPIRPWTNWADVHSNFSRIDLYPALFTPPLVLRAFYVLWWMVPLSTILFVAFFAFGREAMIEYKKCIVWFRTTILRQSTDKTGTKNSFMTLPSLCVFHSSCSACRLF